MTANNILRSEETYSQFSLICALNFSDLLAAFVELKSGHGLNAASCGGLLIRIDINLGKDNRGKFFLHFFVNRRNHFAGPAPRGRKVDDDQRLRQRVTIVVKRDARVGGCVPQKRLLTGILEEWQVF